MSNQNYVNKKNADGEFENIRQGEWEYDEVTGNSFGHILYDQAVEMFLQKRYAEALDTFRKALELDLHYKTYEYIGRCLLELKRPREAIEPLSAAMTFNRQNYAAFLCAEALVSIGELSYAEMVLDLILSREPGHKKSLSLKRAVKKALEEYNNSLDDG